MRASIAFAIFAVSVGTLDASPAVAQESSGVIELAEQGYLTCHVPNTQRRTCKVIETLEHVSDNLYNSVTLTAVGNGVTLEMHTPVWNVDGIVCGSIREQDVMAGVLRQNGREVAPQIASVALQRAVERLRPMLDQQICTRYMPSGADFVAKYALGETYRPDWDEPVKMVDRSEGYRLAP